MQIGPPLGNCRPPVIRSFRPLHNKKAAHFARLLRSLVWTPHFSEATGPFDAGGSGSKPNTPTRYL
jgi:hypothetical protein